MFASEDIQIAFGCGIEMENYPINETRRAAGWNQLKIHYLITRTPVSFLRTVKQNP